MYKIILSKTIKPSWLDEDYFFIPCLEDINLMEDVQESQVLATFQREQQKECPLIIKNSSGVKLLFNIEKTIRTILLEGYLKEGINHGIFAKLPFDYNKLPMWFIGLMAKVLTKKINIEDLPKFPMYPLDYSVDILKHLEPSYSPLSWPQDKKYAVCFTHDVDTEWIFKNPYWLDRFRDIEEENNIRSAWYVVPKEIKSKKTREQLSDLVGAGHEIGAHGYTHDPGLPHYPQPKLKLYLQISYETIKSFAPDQNIGYRAPWLARNQAMFETLAEAGFSYDSSVPASDFNGGNVITNNGCCTVFPYKNANITILPVTIPLDVASRSLQKNPIEFYDWVYGIVAKIKKVGGVVVITTHTSPHLSANKNMLDGYAYFIQKIVSDKDAWITLPHQLVKSI